VAPRTPMHIINEHYHVYNRGAHKAPIFSDKSDYERFVALLYIANDVRPIPYRWSQKEIWIPYSNDALVGVFTYCLMPNHFHLGLIEKRENGIEDFMRKICTSYVMYYNKKYDHSGTIFQGNCKSKHVDRDDYLRYLIEYIHLNPFGIEEPNLMKPAKLEYKEEAIAYSRKYEYSSFKDYLGQNRPQSLLLEVAPPEVPPR
jgi:putative transposase